MDKTLEKLENDIIKYIESINLTLDTDAINSYALGQLNACGRILNLIKLAEITKSDGQK